MIRKNERKKEKLNNKRCTSYNVYSILCKASDREIKNRKIYKVISFKEMTIKSSNGKKKAQSSVQSQEDNTSRRIYKALMSIPDTKALLSHNGAESNHFLQISRSKGLQSQIIYKKLKDLIDV